MQNDTFQHCDFSHENETNDKDFKHSHIYWQKMKFVLVEIMHFIGNSVSFLNWSMEAFERAILSFPVIMILHANNLILKSVLYDV